MTNSDLLALAMPLIGVAAVGLTAVLMVFQIKHSKHRRPKLPSPGVRGRLSEGEAGIFHFQPEAGSPETTAFRKIVEKQTAEH